ncbi:hypothetical protein GCM10008932_07400 [Alkalibacterium iburiense]|uniref:Uncharacterized protein n=1 Tax=Alkalibacterium iburiense TaxID=290589 RepID=A0ABP3GX45_9LACT
MTKKIFNSLLLLFLGFSIFAQTSISVHAYEENYSNISYEESITDTNPIMDKNGFNNPIIPFSPPSQGGDGGGYSNEWHYYGDSRNANSTANWLYGQLIGWGLSFIPNLKYFSSSLVTTVLAHALSNRSVVYYKVSTYITNTSDRGRQIRSTILVYSDMARTNLIGQNTRLAFEY